MIELGEFPSLQGVFPDYLVTVMTLLLTWLLLHFITSFIPREVRENSLGEGRYPHSIPLHCTAMHPMHQCAAINASAEEHKRITWLQFDPTDDPKLKLKLKRKAHSLPCNLEHFCLSLFCLYFDPAKSAMPAILTISLVSFPW